jgi:septal ring factor EnvC (AmiA/AmiB activator)
MELDMTEKLAHKDKEYHDFASFIQCWRDSETKMLERSEGMQRDLQSALKEMNDNVLQVRKDLLNHMKEEEGTVNEIKQFIADLRFEKQKDNHEHEQRTKLFKKLVALITVLTAIASSIAAFLQ